MEKSEKVCLEGIFLSLGFPQEYIVMILENQAVAKGVVDCCMKLCQDYSDVFRRIKSVRAIVDRSETCRLSPESLKEAVDLVTIFGGRPTVATVARKFGYSRAGVYKFLKKFPECEEFLGVKRRMQK